jgi:Uma2 family endonuclease
MSTKVVSPTQRMTAEQLAALPADDKRYELVAGRLRVMNPAGNVHGRVAARLLIELGQYVEQHKLGIVYAAETGFLLARNPDTVRAPDVAFVAQERFEAAEQTGGYLQLAPDLVAEVVSPSDSYSQVEEKALAWLGSGVAMVLVVDPGTQTVQVYRGTDNIVSLGIDERIVGDDVVAGWSLSKAKGSGLFDLSFGQA